MARVRLEIIMSNPSTVSAVTPADVLTVCAKPVATSPAVSEPQATPRTYRAAELSAIQRSGLSARLAKATAAKKRFTFPAGIDAESFLDLFDADQTIDPQSSAAYGYTRDQTRKNIAAAIRHDIAKL